VNAARLLAGGTGHAAGTTALGSLLGYVTQRGKKAFQPMNANYGLFRRSRARGRDKKLAMAERALAELDRWRQSVHLESDPASRLSVA
jgi:folate-dependent tRNA-U54 methylase TrmFO/GidA